MSIYVFSLIIKRYQNQISNLFYFIKNDSAISYIVDFKIKPSKFQFLCTIKKGFYRKYAIRWSTLYIYVCSKNVVDVDCQTQRRLKLMIKLYIL
jgi:hypothetical protein